MTLNDIGVDSGSLFCLTNNTQCCGSSDTPSGEGGVGEWYFPNNGSAVGTEGEHGSIYRNKGPSVVHLHRRNNAMMPTGVYHCEIPDANGTRQNIYVGIYPQGDGESLECSVDVDCSDKLDVTGSPSITSVLLDRNSTTLTCTSTGGPPTTVTWRKNGVLVDDSLFHQSQRVVDTENSTYENVLFNDDITYFVGIFTCEISNVRDIVRETMELNGALVCVLVNEFVIHVHILMYRCVHHS